MNSQFDYKALGKRIRSARIKRGMTQEKLAEACDLSTAHIGHIERGTRTLSIESLITISEVLEISTDYLLFNVSKSENKDISVLLNTIDMSDKEKFKKLYGVIKVLIENVEKI